MKKIYFLLAFCFGCAVNAQIVNIPDANFKAKLLQANTYNTIALDVNNDSMKIDVNNDGNIQQSEALLVYRLDVSYSSLINLTGIQSFLNLKDLNCDYNQITSLNLTGLTNLKSLSCSFNQIPNLDLNGLLNLEELSCGNNNLPSLNVNSLINLKSIYCGFNQLTSIDLNGLTNLIDFNCSGNPITILDVSSLSNLIFLLCSGTQMTTLFMKNNEDQAWFQLEFNNNPNLRYICADSGDISFIQNKILLYGYTNCHVNTYCSFEPAGTVYNIDGISRLDFNINGCDSNDITYPNLRLNVTNGTEIATFYTDSSGNYNIPVQSGTHIIQPQLENNTYFSVSPSNNSITFPTQTSPAITNFCITSNGIHQDVEILIFPISVARPGFNATYRLIYKNKGNIEMSGTINLFFNDVVLDFVSASPTIPTLSSNNLTWSYSNLLPLETRVIEFILNANSPMETPPLNIGDQLDFDATINPVVGDEIPFDNICSLKQTVVGSYDPNDKTCLEGATITPDKVGEYVHYIIRFENTGTANAQNVVVKDLIDTTKFDVSTLIPIDGSHEFYTRITNTNQVEFIFENIQLPFDDANNDGYVAFKIKTKSTLVEGNSFSNSANIYFDYNFPIVTNTATTTIQALGTSDFEFSNYIQLTPNPAIDVLNITSKKDIEISSISIYNALGQLVIVIPNANETASIDVSQLTSGTYFVKVLSDKGNSTSKFIKQ